MASPQTAPQIHWGGPATYQVSGGEGGEPPAQLPGLGTDVEGSPPWVPWGLPLGPLCVQVPGPLKLSLPAHHSFGCLLSTCCIPHCAYQSAIQELKEEGVTYNQGGKVVWGLMKGFEDPLRNDVT